MEAGDSLASSASKVRGTNDWCMVSKASMAKARYVSDPYASIFVEEESQRSSLIHRGYYARHKVLEMCIAGARNAVEELKGEPVQILSLGSGFDTLSFNLHYTMLNQSVRSLSYFEVDLAHVIERKREIIAKHPQASKVAEGYLNLCAADLEDLTGVKAALDNAGFVWDRPTIVLAECSLINLPLESVRPLLMWLAVVLKQAVIILCEQIQPDDAFGVLMEHHFRRTGGRPLRTLHFYEDLERQYRRFFVAGWPDARAADIAYLWDNQVPAEDKRRIDALEPFDEYEEFYVKCLHHVLAVAGKGDLGLAMMTRAMPFYQYPTPHDMTYNPSDPANDLAVEVTDTLDLPSPRCGHAAQVLRNPRGYSMVLGGVAAAVDWSKTSAGQSRREHVQVYDEKLTAIDDITVAMSSPEKNAQPELERMHAALFPVPKSDQVMVIGGRHKSTMAPFGNMTKLEFASEEKKLLCHIMSSEDACKRWRHVAAWVTLPKPRALGGVFVHGGRVGSDGEVLGDGWIFSENTGKWTQIAHGPEKISPCARHSHAIATRPNPSNGFSDVFISGGLTTDQRVLDDIWHYDVAAEGWTKVTVAGFQKRFGHQMHVWKGRLLVVGGVSSDSDFFPGVTLVDMKRGVCSDVSMIAFFAPWPNFFWGHQCFWDPENPDEPEEGKEKTKVRVVGGGGECYSLGTCCNIKLLELDISRRK